jgi:hypothetical protein
MSNPDEHQSTSSPDPRAGQQPMPVQPAQPGQDLTPPAQWQPTPPAGKQHNGLAIAALVVACLALVIVVGGFVSQLVFGFIFTGESSSNGEFPSSSSQEGTAPQVIAGHIYPGALLQDEVERVVRGDEGEVTSVSCPPTPAVVVGAVTVCQGGVDGSDWTFRVTFRDRLGHFTLEEKLS